MVLIRKVKSKDFETIRKISLKASSHPDKSGDELMYHYALYTDYYTTYQTDNSFVAVDENDEAKGYILCAKNFDEYEKTMTEEIIPRFKNTELKERAMFEIGSYRRFKDEYTAHLHIAIDPDYQHGGVGTKLIQALIADLKGKQINGIMLEVTNKNTKAIRFYEKNGFHVIFDFEYGKLMGIKLNESSL